MISTSNAESTIRVTGTIDERFVTFEFSLSDPDLSVELVMEPEQFRQFCDRHRARLLTAEEGQALDLDRLKWRYGQPGLDA